MASVIDAFITTLALDGTLFRKGMQDAEKSKKRFDDIDRKSAKEREKQERDAAAADKKRQKEHDERVKSTVKGYTLIRNQLLTIAAVFTAGVGIKDFITSTINGAAGLGYLSANLKQSTQELTSWQRASERAGGSSDGIIAQLKESQDTLAQLRTGQGPNEGLQNFFRWGGNPEDLKDGNTYLLARSRIIHDTFKVDPAKAALISKAMGISEEQFNFLKQGPAAVMDLVRAQEKNAVITERDAAASLELKNKMLDLRDTLQSVGIKVLTALLPSLIKFSDWLISMADYVAAHRDDIAGFFSNLAKADFSGVISQTKGFAADVKDLTENIKELLAIWHRWTNKDGKIPTTVEGISEVVGKNVYPKGEGAKDKVERKKTSDVGVHGEQVQSVGLAFKEFWARTLASFGNKDAARYIRDTTGKDDYLVGPDKVADTKTTSTVMQKLKDMGWTHEQAAGITGSFTQESGLNPASRNPKSGAYGIAQWLGPRVDDFKKIMGRDLVGSTLEQQLAFFDYEVTQGNEQAAGKKLAATRTAEDAARVHSEAYERPGKDEANIARRQQLARALASQARVTNAASAASMPAGAAATAAATTAAAASGSTSTTTVTVEKIEVHTAATDAKGIAQSLRPAVEKYTVANQANSGMR